ncbi:MAG: hypothetical protein CMH54_14455 [Myxococcales bacterium]|nr:hypothetical protein [Myxococcales bacterium]|tara:strand:+ start:488 stop:1084 length:597 start_codon:yes stop_codon:yes gene_type:complete
MASSSKVKPLKNSSPETESDAVERHVLAVCDAVGAFIEWWGFKAVHGRVWTYMALRNMPVSQTELVDVFGVSRSLISGSIHQLLELGLVRPCGDHRNAPYEAAMDVWPVVTNVIRSREWIMIENARTALESLIEEATYAPERSARYDLERMRLLLTMTETAQAFVRILMKLRVPKSLEGVGSVMKRAAGIIQGIRHAS